MVESCFFFYDELVIGKVLIFTCFYIHASLKFHFVLFKDKDMYKGPNFLEYEAF